MRRSYHAKLGKIVTDPKTEKLKLKGASRDATWVLGENLAVAIRDLLRLFAEETPCVGNYIYKKLAPDMDLLEAQEKIDVNEAGRQWRELLLDLSNKFNYIATWDDTEREAPEEWEKAYTELEDTKAEAFKLLGDVFGDLWW